jgi:hypothetical protein
MGLGWVVFRATHVVVSDLLAQQKEPRRMGVALDLTAQYQNEADF